MHPTTQPPLGALGQRSGRIVAAAERYIAALYGDHNADEVDAAADGLMSAALAVEGIQRLAVITDLALLAAKLGADE